MGLVVRLNCSVCLAENPHAVERKLESTSSAMSKLWFVVWPIIVVVIEFRLVMFCVLFVEAFSGSWFACCSWSLGTSVTVPSGSTQLRKATSELEHSSATQFFLTL